MRKLLGIGALGLFVAAASVFFQVHAQKLSTPLPKVASASVPLYPPLAGQARIQGIVVLSVSTDGQQVSAVNVRSGHPLLASAAKENVATWRFAPHAPTKFDVKFEYRLLDYPCKNGCDCDTKEADSVLIRFPADIQVTAPIPLICDPAAPIKTKN